MADDRFCQKQFSIRIPFDTDTPQEVVLFIHFLSHCQSLISASNRLVKKDIDSL